MQNKFKFLLITAALFALQLFAKSEQSIIHKAHLSSGWYLQNKVTLRKDLNDYFMLSQKHFPVAVDPSSIKALIVPHAGHYFSGLCAASAYQCLKDEENKNKKIKRVIILSPTHVKAFEGVALPDYDIYQTTLGDVFVDKDSIESLKLQKHFLVNTELHNKEHAIEVQLPFLQEVVSDFKIVPLIVGFLNNDSYDQISDSLGKLIDDNTLIVISSDFTHYGEVYRYVPFEADIVDRIRQIDSLAFEAIQNKSFSEFSDVLKKTRATICGSNAIKVLLKLFERKHLGGPEIHLSSYYTSPHIVCSRKLDKKIDVQKLFGLVDDREANTSVSYLSAILSSQERSEPERTKMLTGYEKSSLLKLARESIKNKFSQKKRDLNFLYPIKSLGLKQRVGAFVTLNTRSGNLRGCIGKIVSSDPLYKTVSEMAKAAAFSDTRFKSVSKEELKNLVIDITVLTQPRVVSSYNEIKIGTHGIILRKNRKSAVFLPQVPGSFGWDLKTTLEHLSVKAGLKKDEWKVGCEFQVFEGFEVKEN